MNRFLFPIFLPPVFRQGLTQTLVLATSLVLLVGTILPNPALATDGQLEIRGNIEAQLRFFNQAPLSTDQSSTDVSVAATPEFFYSWNDSKDSLELVPFGRADQHDNQRTHADIREFSWLHVGNNWESRIGIRRVFWGVTEFQHLVDIINQTDAVEDVDNEDKLGQAMLNLSQVMDWGILDFYILPGFRERSFSGIHGRPRLAVINQDQSIYESSAGRHHVDYALRWSHSIGDFDLGISGFRGTSRDPSIMPSPDPTAATTLIPFYPQIAQFGLELQATTDTFLWKLEAIRNSNKQQDFSALQGGLEYTQYGIFDSGIDLGWLFEYGWDSRGKNGGSVNQNDLYLGSRLTFNDADSSEMLFGLSSDRDFHSTSLLLEASKRFGDSIKISLDLRAFSITNTTDPLYSLRRDNHIQLTTQYFY